MTDHDKHIGPLMIDLMGTEISSQEKEWLRHPAVGAVILFTRNYVNKPQLRELIAELRDVKQDDLLIAVDQEGGRVQRFREGFINYPPMCELGSLFDQDPQQARYISELFAWSLATELREFDIDFSFTPVLDVETGLSAVIGDRALHQNVNIIAELAVCFMQGLQKGGMQAVGKHFPGHGSVRGDSHYELPVDDRVEKSIRKHDLIPFKHLIDHDIAGLMSAHVVYSSVENIPASFSEYWLTQVLRNELNYDGVIFSDDLTMQGAKSYGDLQQRLQSTLQAGSDMALICNSPNDIPSALAQLEDYDNALSARRLKRFCGATPKKMPQADIDALQTFIQNTTT